MNLDELNKVALAMVAPGKGILAADESTGTIGKRFDAIATANTEDNRRDYREMMFRTGSQLVFHMQLAKKRDAAPIVRDYITDTQRHFLALERERLAAAPK